MANTRETESTTVTRRLEFDYGPPWWVTVLVLAFVACVVGWWLALPSYGVGASERVVSIGCLALGFIMCLILLGREVRNRVYRLRKVVLTDGAIHVPCSPTSFTRTSVPYNEITAVEEVHFVNYPRSRVLRVTHRDGRFKLSSAFLPRKSDYDDILHVLAERLEPFGVAVDSHKEWFGIRWGRPQFSLRSMLILMTLVAFLLGTRLYIDPQLYWRDLFPVVFGMVFVWIPVLLLLSGSRFLLVFGIGYAVGIMVEFCAVQCWVRYNLIQLVPGSLVPLGWYPLTLPIDRIMVTLGWVEPFIGIAYAQFVAAAISGIVVGLSAAFAWWLVRRVLRAMAGAM